MNLISIAAGGLGVLLWTWLLLARGRFWQVARRVFVPVERGDLVRVAAIVPARDEAETIAVCITSLLHQQGCDLHVFLVDDDSRDGTAEAARQAARRAGQLNHVTIIPGRSLPPGWSGKLWAVEQGITAARALAPRFLLLSDADVVHAPGNVAGLAGAAETGRYDLLSLMVKLHCERVAEKLLIPAFVFFFFMLYPPAWVADPRRATAAAAGGCILVRPEALARAGGIEAIRAEIIDDCALARAIKRSGGRIWLGLARSTPSLRQYAGFADVGRMIARTAFNQLRHSTWLLAATVAGMGILYVAPLALLFCGRMLPVALGAAGWAMMTLAYLPMVRFYRLHPLWALTLPLAAVFYVAATVKSALDFWSGRGGQWKGRAQDVQAKVVDDAPARR